MCVPNVREDVANVPTAEPLRVPVPMEVPPSKKVTVPVGMPDPGLVIVAVNVTELPTAAGVIDETSAVKLALSAPEPPTGTVWVPASDTKVITSLKGPLTVGANSIPSTQLSPGFSVMPVVQ